MSDGKVVIDTQLNASGAQQGMKGLANALSKIGKLVAVAFSVKAVVGFSKAAIGLASDIEEVQNVVDTAFGDMSYKMEKFADSAIEMYGISKLSAKQTGSTFMAMARGLGLGMESASDMSIALTALSADMASFYNVSQDVASTALKSVFTGETETLKRYGIVMTEANLQQFALSQGIKKSLKDMTQAEKTQIRYGYVMQQTALAQGDFAKTQDSWANQTRILSEQWKEFMSVVGQGLIKALSPLLKTLNSILKTIINISKALSEFFGITTSSEPESAIDGMTGSMEDYTEEVEDAEKAQKRLAGGLDELNVLSKDTSKQAGADSGLFENLSGTGNYKFDFEQSEDKFQDTITPKITNMLNNLKTILDSQIPVIKEKFNNLVNVFSPVITDMISPVLTTIFTGILGVVNTFTGSFATSFGSISTSMSTILTGMVTYVTSLTPLFEVAITSVFSLFSTVLTTEIERMTTILGGIATLMEPLNTYMQESFVPTMTGITETLAEVATSAYTTFSDAFSQLWELVIMPFAENFLTDFLPTLTEGFGTVAEILSGAYDSFEEIFNDVWTIVILPFLTLFSTDMLPTLTDIFAQVIQVAGTLFQAIKTIFDTFWKTGIKPVLHLIKTVILGVWESLKTFWETYGVPIMSAIQTAINKTKNVILKLWNQVLQPLWQGLIDKLSVLWKDHLKPCLDEILKFAGDIIKALLKVYNKVIVPFVSWFIDNILTPIVPVLDSILDVVVGIFGGIIDTIKGVVGALRGVLSFIGNIFKGKWKSAWNDVKNIFNTIWNTLQTTAKTVLNPIIGFLNTILSGLATAINAIIGALNKLSFDVPDWVPGIGGETWGFNISKVTALQIPKLAQGAVLPANQPFMAMVGDQKHGTNVEAPLDTIKQALAEALKENQQKVIFEVEGDPNGLFRVFLKKMEEYSRMTGKPMPI